MPRRYRLCAALFAATFFSVFPMTATLAADELAWPAPTAQNRLWTRWWWLGNAVDAPGITGQLEQFKLAGLGGVEICPIYGTLGAEDKYIPFLSPQWMDMLSHTYRETKRLDMAVDMTTGTGWPFGGPMVNPAMASASLTLRTYDHYPTPEELPRGTLLCLMLYPPDNEPPSDVTGKQVKAVAGSRFVAAVTNSQIQKVKRSAPGGEGNVLDPYSVESLTKYLDEFDKAFEGFQDDIPRGQFHDSFEYYGATWTPNLFAEFQKRRGYDLKPHLRALAGEGDKDAAARIKHDYRETLSDLHEAYMRHWTQWSHKHGSVARNQAHGGPGNLIDVYAGSDIPECEIFHLYDESQLPMLKLASSAANLTGKKLASAESFTWLGEHFSVPLADVKPAADFLFLAGINHLFLHGIPYSPPDAAWPGWQFYASVNFGPQGGLWRDMPAFAAYVARCQSILQANKPSNDVLLYAPWHQFWTEMDPAGLMTQFKMPDPWMKPYAFYEAATTLHERGIAYDAISDKLLLNAKVKDGRIDIAGNLYRAMIIPKTPTLPVETMKHLVELARQGATIAFQEQIPADVPGFHDLEPRRGQLKQALGTPTFDAPAGLRSAAVGQGRILVGNDLPALLERAGVEGEPMVRQGLRFLRRERPDGFDYFIVNRSEKAVQGVQLGSAAGRPRATVILDPRFDNRAGFAKSAHAGDVTTVDLHIAPGEAYFVRTFDYRMDEGTPWLSLVPAADPIALDGTWNVAFIEGGPTLPKPFTTRQPGSWTDQPDPEAQRFAGTARYTLKFARPSGNAVDYLLDLGKVGDSAQITLNGKPLGPLWSAPFRLQLGTALQPGDNTLEIEVTNVAANRIRDMDQRGVQWKIFRDINVVDTKYTPMDASKWPVRPAGLSGPVTITPLRAP